MQKACPHHSCLLAVVICGNAPSSHCASKSGQVYIADATSGQVTDCNPMKMNGAIVSVGIITAILAFFPMGRSIAQTPTLKVPVSLLDKKEICVTTVYEGAPRGPGGFVFPSFDKPKRGLVGNTPAKHITFFIFENDGTWDYKHLTREDFGWSDREFDFDSEFSFSRVPSGFQYCSERPHLELSCASFTKEGRKHLCAPLFKTR